ncbi:MAG: FeoB-associated Cys-rich membrane protein [Desulfovibrionaceae bacterium]|nr:FeoB-associated Cys-rich membrane protein [Desulfovibrionaceae bacterium]MBF0513298.1 FeoB-associated Cys-rich membrane protein [Desulfovibrionaceae bacterium]
MRGDTIAVVVICVLALGYFIHRTRKSFRGGSSCGCSGGCADCAGHDNRGASAPKSSKEPGRDLPAGG